MDSVVLQHLTIGYVSKSIRKVVANGINGAIRSGELTCLLGRNGVGKSTLLRTLAAFQPALEGDILIAEASQIPAELSVCSDVPQNAGFKALASFSDKELSHTIGIVLTEKPDVHNMSVEDMVGMGRSPYTGFWGTLSKEDKAIVQKAIRQTGIESLHHRMVRTLSDGERQKVMIAKALAQQTPIIYLDEPTAFLDFPSKVETMQLLHRLAAEEQKTIFLSTHDVELALQLSDCIWLMEPDGLYIGTPHELAIQGMLNRFIERDGIHFDRETLTIQVTH